MTLHKQITRELSHHFQDAVLKDMGYNSLKVGRKTLNNFLNTKNIYIWLKNGHYDLKFASESFLLALVKALNIPPEDYQTEIKKAQNRIAVISKMAEPSIFVDTNFKRKNEPVFVLALMSSRRYIKVNKEQLVNKSDQEIFEKISLIIKRHYKSTDGKLPFWGEIRAYVYHHSNGKKYLFSTDGLMLPSREIPEPKAELKIKNKLILGG